MPDIEYTCSECAGTGYYETESMGTGLLAQNGCETCDGSGMVVPSTAYRGAVAEAEKWKRIAQDRCTCVVTCGDRPEDKGGICKDLPRGGR